MNTNKIKSVIALIIVTAIISATFFGCGKKADDNNETTVKETTTQATFTDLPTSVKKTETIYTNLDENGNVKKTIVSDWLHTDKGNVVVNDISNLKNIENVKSDIKPITDGENLTWHMDSTDLYYKGETKENLPVGISIKYYLNDKEISADKIAGKSGKVKIVVKMTNNDKHTVDVNGVQTEVVNPFIVIGGMILPEDKFENIAIQNGRAIGDGSKEIALMIGMPDMNSSLGLDQIDTTKFTELNLPDEFTITTDAKDFELGNMYFAAFTLASFGINNDNPSTIETLKSTLASIKSVGNSIKTVDSSNLFSTFMKITSTSTTENQEVNQLTQIANQLDEYSSVADNADFLAARLNAMLDVGGQYRLFTSAPEGMSTEVMFIFNTPSIKADVTEKSDKNEVKEQNWFKKLFSKS